MLQVATDILLAGKYRLESLIGRGGMGSVWRAEHLGLHAPVAVKLLDQVEYTGNFSVLPKLKRTSSQATRRQRPER
jgi:serine/threonine-protein kinase